MLLGEQKLKLQNGYVSVWHPVGKGAPASAATQIFVRRPEADGVVGAGATGAEVGVGADVSPTFDTTLALPDLVHETDVLKSPVRVPSVVVFPTLPAVESVIVETAGVWPGKFTVNWQVSKGVPRTAQVNFSPGINVVGIPVILAGTVTYAICVLTLLLPESLHITFTCQRPVILPIVIVASMAPVFPNKTVFVVLALPGNVFSWVHSSSTVPIIWYFTTWPGVGAVGKLLIITLLTTGFGAS